MIDILDSIEIHNREKFNPQMLKNVETNLDKSCESDVVFYRMNDGSVLLERLKKGNPGLVIFNRDPDMEIEQPYVVVSESDFFSWQYKICNACYPLKFEEKKIIGVTGTNGKTSVCHFLAEMLVLAGKSTLTFGTLGVLLKDSSGQKMVGECGLTTPAYIFLRKKLFQYRNEFDCVVMELSSHGLEQNRLGDIQIDLGIWTNFTRDHLDYHETMGKYFSAKAKIFDCLKPDARILVHKDHREILDNLDDSHRIQTMIFDETVLPAQEKSSDTSLFHGFMLKNVAAAAFAMKNLFDVNMDPLNDLTLPPGRFNIVKGGGKTVVVDYAHTPDALENLIFLAKSFFKGKRINLLLGCGGDRDKGKRAKMGEVAWEHASKVYLTSDNPRDEEPQDILQQIRHSLTGKFIEEVDRRVAIGMAIDEMKSDEILLVAGKGHERYQEIRGVKYPFNDLELVKEYLELA